jgi:hypothetical protein
MHSCALRIRFGARILVGGRVSGRRGPRLRPFCFGVRVSGPSMRAGGERERVFVGLM